MHRRFTYHYGNFQCNRHYSFNILNENVNESRHLKHFRGPKYKKNEFRLPRAIHNTKNHELRKYLPHQKSFLRLIELSVIKIG